MICTKTIEQVNIFSSRSFVQVNIISRESPRIHLGNIPVFRADGTDIIFIPYFYTEVGYKRNICLHFVQDIYIIQIKFFFQRFGTCGITRQFPYRQAAVSVNPERNGFVRQRIHPGLTLTVKIADRKRRERISAERTYPDADILIKRNGVFVCAGGIEAETRISGGSIRGNLLYGFMHMVVIAHIQHDTSTHTEITD